MGKKKTIDKKDAINPKGGISERERREVHATMTGADLIKSSIKLAALTNKIAGGGSAGLLTSLVMAIGDTIGAIAYSCDVSRKKAMDDLFGLIRDYVNDDSHFEEKPDMDLN